MNLLEHQHQNQNCPECQSALIDDMQNGETICSGCGMVVADQVVDQGPELANAVIDDKERLVRATGMTTYSQHDLGIATSIAIGTKDFSGKTIDSQVASQMHNLRKWQQRVRVASAKERRLANVLTKINEACCALGFSRNLLETASLIYRNFDSQVDMKNRSVVSITAASLYMACKQCDVVRSMEEICREICSPRELRTKTKLAAKYYRSMVMEMGQKSAPIVTLDRYISKIANMTDTEVRVERLALEIAEKTRSNKIADGKAPNGLAAAYLYIASILLGHNVLQRDVSTVAGVTEVTVRNRCREILSNYTLKIALRPSLARQSG